MEYRWMLRKGSKKEICPRCGQRRFVPYVLASDGVTMAGAEFGRCDREQHCGYILYPNSETAPTAAPAAKTETTPATPIRVRNIFLKQLPQVPTDFLAWMCTLLEPQQASHALLDYMVRGYGGRVCFLQVDGAGDIHAGKLIKYKADGHRDKNAFPPVQWLHKVPAAREYVAGDELEQCLFGEHLLFACPDKPVAIVESEKTALVLSEIVPAAVWVATGGSQGLKRLQHSKALQGRDVMLVPDNGCYWMWKGYTEGREKWRIWDGCERAKVFDGCDILDIIETKKRNK